MHSLDWPIELDSTRITHRELIQGDSLGLLESFMVNTLLVSRLDRDLISAGCKWVIRYGFNNNIKALQSIHVAVPVSSRTVIWANDDLLLYMSCNGN